MLGIDYGDARTGVSVALGSGPALPLCFVDSSRGRKAAAVEIADIAAARHVTTIVIGYPVNMDGSRGKRVVATEKFARVLGEELISRGVNADIKFWDERLTSKAAEAELRSLNYSGGRSGASDQIAAAIILQDYIDHLRSAVTPADTSAEADDHN